MITQRLELPSDGLITRAVFEELPVPSGRWAWQLRSGRLELTHNAVTGWQWLTVVEALKHWQQRGHATAGDQYVADAAFMTGGAGGTILAVGGVAFKLGHSPMADADTHSAADVHAIIRAIPAVGDEHDAVEDRAVFARLGVPCYWIIRKESPDASEDGLISMYGLMDGAYSLVERRAVSQL